MRAFVIAYLASLAVLTAVAIAGSALLFTQTAPESGAAAAAAPHAHNLVRWEIRHLPEKWLYEVGDLFTDPQDGQADDDVIREYMELVRRIEDHERTGRAPEQLAAALNRAADLENRVEDIIEGRVTAVLEDEGLTIGPPPFTDMEVIFPPVDFELDTSPTLLVTSPRDRIERGDSYLLSPGLDVETATDIEAESEAEGDESAIVVQTGGVAMYPSVINSGKDYQDLVNTVFHEWLHQHLILFPLGQSYLEGGDPRVLNESVASVAGRELAAEYFERYPDPTELRRGPPSPAESAGFDFRAEMRQLRLDVDELLADGKVDEAEALMGQRRDEFEDQGVYIRRINQAYFAFYGSYSDAAGSIDPIGPKLEELYTATGSPGDFIRALYGVTSRDDLDAALAAISD